MRTSPGRLVLLSRLATVLIALVAFGLALMALFGSRLIDGMVAYAWTGLGASFGPALLLSLWWKGTTRRGVLAGMVGGMAATIVWQNSVAITGLLGASPALNFNDFLDIKAGPVLISAFLVAAFSLMDRAGEGSRMPSPS